MADRLEPFTPTRVAALNPLGGPGTRVPTGVSSPAFALPVVVRNDTPALSRLPVSIARPVWTRFSYQGIHTADTPTPLAGTSSTPGPVCGAGGTCGKAG